MYSLHASKYYRWLMEEYISLTLAMLVHLMTSVHSKRVYKYYHRLFDVFLVSLPPERIHLHLPAQKLNTPRK